MLGAIIGDTVGSVYEFNNIKIIDFPLFSVKSNYTDDSIMTMAVASWLLNDSQHTMETLEEAFLSFAKKYPCPMGGYGGMFFRWLFNSKNKREPYNSWGNGSAMRVSAVGWMFDTLEETEHVAGLSAAITHNHPEGIKGAQATAAAIFMARSGKSKEEIRDYISTKYGYNLNRTCDEIRPVYDWDASCQGTVPEAMVAFFDSTDFESAIRLAVSLGGDSDTLACITGGIAEAFYKDIPDDIALKEWSLLPEDFKVILKEMTEKSHYKLPQKISASLILDKK
jgi:ADP-ribosylglycohydrolase